MTKSRWQDVVTEWNSLSDTWTDLSLSARSKDLMEEDAIWNEVEGRMASLRRFIEGLSRRL